MIKTPSLTKILALTGFTVATTIYSVNPAQATNLVSNGSFESSGGVGQLTGGITTLDNWTVGTPVDGAPSPFVFITDNNADSTGLESVFGTLFIWGTGNGVNNGFTGSSDGGYFLGINSSYGTAPISQTISGLTIGNNYTLSFEWAGSQLTNTSGDTQQGLNITFGGDTVSTTAVNVPSKGFNPWQTESYTFTATSTTQTLSFLATGTSGLSPFTLLDGVSLTENTITPPAAVPEPLTILGAATAIGFGANFKRRLAKAKENKKDA